MIGFTAQQRVQERLSSWLVAATMGFDRNKNSINFGELFRIIQTKNPTAVRFAVQVQNPEIRWMILLVGLGISLSPNLESTGRLDTRLMVEIKGIKDQRFALGIEDTAKGLAGTATTVHIKDVRDVKLARAHQLANVTVGRKKLLIVL